MTASDLGFIPTDSHLNPPLIALDSVNADPDPPLIAQESDVNPPIIILDSRLNPDSDLINPAPLITRHSDRIKQPQRVCLYEAFAQEDEEDSFLYEGSLTIASILRINDFQFNSCRVMKDPIASDRWVSNSARFDLHVGGPRTITHHHRACTAANIPAKTGGANHSMKAPNSNYSGASFRISAGLCSSHESGAYLCSDFVKKMRRSMGGESAIIEECEHGNANKARTCGLVHHANRSMSFGMKWRHVLAKRPIKIWNNHMDVLSTTTNPRAHIDPRFVTGPNPHAIRPNPGAMNSGQTHKVPMKQVKDKRYWQTYEGIKLNIFSLKGVSARRHGNALTTSRKSNLVNVPSSHSLGSMHYELHASIQGAIAHCKLSMAK